MIAIFDPDNYNNILEAIESDALYHTNSTIDDDYTALYDCLETIQATAECLGKNVKIYYTYDKKNYQPIEEKLAQLQWKW